MQEHGELALMEHREGETDGKQERDKGSSGERVVWEGGRERERQTDRQAGERGRGRGSVQSSQIVSN